MPRLTAIELDAMGAGNSKQDARGEYQWKASGPPGLSLDVLESLQASPEVAHILDPYFFRPAHQPCRRKCSRRPNPPDQSVSLASSGVGRVANVVLEQTDASRAKLLEQQVQARVAEELKKLQRREAEALQAAHEKIASRASDEDETGPSRHTVSKEVEELRRKLESRKKLRTLPDGVENARSEVVRCLRENDRRPLDCWQEVEKFKTEVKKLEKGWVDKVIS